MLLLCYPVKKQSVSLQCVHKPLPFVMVIPGKLTLTMCLDIIAGSYLRLWVVSSSEQNKATSNYLQACCLLVLQQHTVFTSNRVFEAITIHNITGCCTAKLG